MKSSNIMAQWCTKAILNYLHYYNFENCCISIKLHSYHLLLWSFEIFQKYSIEIIIRHSLPGIIFLTWLMMILRNSLNKLLNSSWYSITLCEYKNWRNMNDKALLKNFILRLSVKLAWRNLLLSIFVSFQILFFF